MVHLQIHLFKLQKTKKKVAEKEEAIAQLEFDMETKENIIEELGKVSDMLVKQAEKMQRVSIASLEQYLDAYDDILADKEEGCPHEKEEDFAAVYYAELRKIFDDREQNTAFRRLGVPNKQFKLNEFKRAWTSEMDKKIAERQKKLKEEYEAAKKAREEAKANAQS